MHKLSQKIPFYSNNERNFSKGMHKLSQKIPFYSNNERNFSIKRLKCNILMMKAVANVKKLIIYINLTFLFFKKHLI